MHTQKPLSNSPAVSGITKRGTGKPLRVWSLLRERDKSRNRKLAAIRMAGAFVHWRQVGNLVFNDQLVSLRFTFQSPPFCPQLILSKLCLISSPQAPGNRHSSPCFFLEKKKKSPGPPSAQWEWNLKEGSGKLAEASTVEPYSQRQSKCVLCMDGFVLPV